MSLSLPLTTGSLSSRCSTLVLVLVLVREDWVLVPLGAVLVLVFEDLVLIHLDAVLLLVLVYED